MTEILPKNHENCKFVFITEVIFINKHCLAITIKGHNDDSDTNVEKISNHAGAKISNNEDL